MPTDFFLRSSAEREARREAIARSIARPVNARRADANRLAAKRNRCPRCERLAGLVRRRDRITGGIVLLCRWCGYLPDAQAIYYGEAKG